MLPAAPARFSTINERLNCLESHSAMRRAWRSLAPPAGNPTMMRTGRVGYACARAMHDMVGSAAAPAARCRNWRRGIFIALLPLTAAFAAVYWRDYGRSRWQLSDKITT